MVTKSRNLVQYGEYKPPGTASEITAIRTRNEHMADSSVSGSARTEVDAVDRFLANPTSNVDFHRALQQSYRTAGDAGLADFRVDRTGITHKPASGSVWIGNLTTGKYWPISGFTMRSPLTSELPSLTPYAAPSTSALRTTGQGLYLNALPNKDQADLAVAIGEVILAPVQAAKLPGLAVLKAAERHGRSVRRLDNRQAIIRKLNGERHHRLRNLSRDSATAAADDYLAYIFGVRPTIGSLDRLGESLSKSRRLAETVSRDGSKRIRRRRALPQKKRIESSVENNVWFLHKSTGNNFGILGTRQSFKESTQDTWYSASYRMPVSDVDDWLEKCSDLFHTYDRLTGLGVDVEVIWDLIPFSFMVDWFANTGDFLKNRQVVSDYNIVCEYGYVMCHTRTTETVMGSGSFLQYPGGVNPSSKVSLSWESLTEVKQRQRCDSFGFQTDFAKLNSFQWGALTALGLSFAGGARPKTRS